MALSRRSPAGLRPHGRLPGARSFVGFLIAVVALMGYFFSRSTNPITGQSQHVALSVDQEIALGLQSAPEMARQFGGELPDPAAQDLVDRVGRRLLERGFEGATLPYPFEFHLLADDKVVNAFALPGGQIFITSALFSRLETEGQLAGVLGHEIGHVVERHSAQHMAKARLTQGLVGAIAVGASDAENPSAGLTAAMIAQAVGSVINMKYGRDDELESDEWGVKLMARAGYDPRAQVRVMEILSEAGGGAGAPEFLSTHPDPGNRIERIRSLIGAMFPAGVPPELQP
ncbi:MAG TPA: peptidase M48 Ste24p [Phycisphaerales bacterium]|nr:peptidase M48 Ste24p [Phycisphaerales bacterium]